MLRGRNISVVLILCLLTVKVIQASYYQDTLFPIGLSGIMTTGAHQVNNCPYSNVGYPNNNPPPWTWSDELRLIDNLGVNCLGCEDVEPGYLIDLNPSNPSENNYLHKVCAPSFASGKPVYVIVSGLYRTSYCHGRRRYIDEANTIPGYPWDPYDSVLSFPHQPYRAEIPSTQRSSSLFRPWDYDLVCGGTVGFACDQFGAKKNENPTSGAAYYGDATWQAMMDEAIENLSNHFLYNNSHAQYIWGFDLLSGLDKDFKKRSILT